MKKTLLLAAAFACAAFTANAANVFESNWSIWTPERQTGYGAGNGSLIADNGSTGGISLGIADGNALASPPGPAALLGDSLYSFMSFPTFTFSSATAWAGVTSLVLEIGYGGSSNETAPISLVYNGSQANAPLVNFIDNGDGGGQMDAARFVNTYTWNFAEAVDLASFDIIFTTVGGHTAYSYFNLSAVAVPEPSTYALILGAVVLGGVAIARRRRA